MKRYFQAVVMGASWGGLAAYRQVLAPLPAGFNLPILLVQHRQPTLDNLLTSLLQDVTPLLVKEAEEKEVIRPGIIYIAPANYHLLVEKNGTLSLTIDERVFYSRPAIDVLFQSAAEVYQNFLLGILLTGASQDGTAGLRAIKQKGGYTLAQDPHTAEASLMPQAAINAQVVDKVATLDEIARFLQTLPLVTP